MTDDDIRYAQNPATAVVLPANAANPNIFAFVVAFPKDLDEDRNVQLSVASGPHKDNELLSPSLCKNYTEQVVEALLKRGRGDLISSTNWASLTAAIQRCINEWNAKRQAPTETVQ